jgi:hypothetical protein
LEELVECLARITHVNESNLDDEDLRVKEHPMAVWRTSGGEAKRIDFLL